MSAPSLRVAIIGGVRFDTFEPHAGGLERHSDVLARALVRAGHDVTVFAGHRPGSAAAPYRHRPITDTLLELSDDARHDVSMPPMEFMVEHDAYLRLEDAVAQGGFDVVHNNSLHYLPVLWRDGPPVVHTLHTPPTPWLESAHRIRCERARGRHRAVSVSHANGRRWGPACDGVVHNGIELDRWRFGSGGQGYAAWTGRVVPEKGPVDAIRAAKAAGMPLLMAGPLHDRRYFDECVAPELDDDRRYVGHLDVDGAAALVAGADVTLVTPRWEEPFGLVVAESAACGTPVAAYAIGAMPELIDRELGRLAPSGDVDALAAALGRARRLDRAAVRRRAVEQFADDDMAARYVTVYRELAER